MKIKAAIFFIFVLAIISCKKDVAIIPTEPAPEPAPEPKKPDLILYTDIPDTLLYCSIPNTSNTIKFTEKYYIDVDSNKVNDFVFSVWTQTTISPSGHNTWKYFYNVFSTISLSDSIILKSTSLTNLCFQEGETIGNYTGSVLLTSPYMQSYTTTFSNNYIGFIKMINGVRHFGWVRFIPGFKLFGDLLITDYAINLTPGNTIKAGQKQ